MSLSETIDKKLVFAFTQKSTFIGKAFFDKYRTANFLGNPENIEKILSQGQELKKCLATVKTGDYVTIDGMFIKPGNPLVIRKSGREDETDITDEEFTLRRLSGLTAAVATSHTFPCLNILEAETIGLNWKTDKLSQKLYLSAVSGTEYFVEHFDTLPFICALRKFQLNMMSEQTLIRIKTMPGVDGQQTVLRSRGLVKDLEAYEKMFWGVPFKMSDPLLFRHSPYSYPEEIISMMKNVTPGSDENQTRDRTEISCVASGNTHQGNSRYRGNSKQCTAMAATAICYSSIKNIRSNISTFNFDTVLQSGDNLYIELEPNISADNSDRYLSGDEIPPEIKVGDELVSITNEYLHTGLYPSDSTTVNVSISQLKDILTREIFTNNWNDDKDGAIFTGGGYSVAFWRYGRHYYLFNSHAVSRENKSCSDGVARIFELKSVESLAIALLEFNCPFRTLYELHKIRVERFSKLTRDTIKDNNAMSAVLPSISLIEVPNTISNSTRNSARSVTKIRRNKWSLTNNLPYKKNP